MCTSLVDKSKYISLKCDDSADIQNILDDILPYAPKELKLLVSEQNEQLNVKGQTGRRWDNLSTIRMALPLWSRSPQAYNDLRDSGYIMLPSKRLLKYYKNRVKQYAGFNEEILNWMKNEGERQNIGESGRKGGILLYLMKCQLMKICKP